MYPRKKMTSKAPTTEAFGSGQQIKDESDTLRAMYGDTYGLIEKEGDALICKDIYQMFKNHKFSTDVEDQDELKILKNIRIYRVFKVEAHADVIPCTNTNTWILKNIYLRDIYICKYRKEPIASFRPKYLEKGYHLEKGIKKLEIKLLNKFEYKKRSYSPNGTRTTNNSNIDPRVGTLRLH
jgi:hypothetical protein